MADGLVPLPDGLAAMAAFLESSLRRARDRFRERPRDGGFSILEHVWHLADLEVEGYGERIGRLRAEERPHLPDFDGARLARERDYRVKDAASGLERFCAARTANLTALSSLAPAEWGRTGTQDGVGAVTLRDLPRMMAAHDRMHREEIKALLDELGA
jgi:hypothetical protein